MNKEQKIELLESEISRLKKLYSTIKDKITNNISEFFSTPN